MELEKDINTMYREDPEYRRLRDLAEKFYFSWSGPCYTDIDRERAARAYEQWLLTLRRLREREIEIRTRCHHNWRRVPPEGLDPGYWVCARCGAQAWSWEICARCGYPYPGKPCRLCGAEDVMSVLSSKGEQ
ncbi:hypothetical protein [Thermogutta sp.]|uniref:hypothetical protein n=1 Tax=Thermogutta sp. TaxID=1962930 RepID=UPI00322004C2